MCKLQIFQTLTICSIKVHSLKYPRSTTSDCKDIRNSESDLEAAN